MAEALISVLIPVKNEADALPGLLNCLQAQTYPHCRTELVFADNGSTDGSQALIQSFRGQSDFAAVALVESPEGAFLPGLNRAARCSHGVYLLRWDAHGLYPPDYNRRAVSCLAAGADVCGGTVEFRPLEDTSRARLLWACERSPFLCGSSPYRRDVAAARPARSVFHPSYRRSALEAWGLWDRRMLRCEDNELHSRILRRGGRIVLDPAISSVHFIRPDLPAMVRQKYGNGAGVARMLLYARDSLHPCYLAPLAFLLSSVLCVGACLLGLWQPLLTLAILYFGCGAVFAARARVRWAAVLPLLFLGLHLSYGYGTLRGLLHGLLHRERAAQADFLPREEIAHGSFTGGSADTSAPYAGAVSIL